MIENGIRIYFSIFASAVFLNCFSKKGVVCLECSSVLFFFKKKKIFFTFRRVDQGVQLKVSNTQPASRLCKTISHGSWLCFSHCAFGSMPLTRTAGYPQGSSGYLKYKIMSLFKWKTSLLKVAYELVFSVEE